MSLLTPPPLNQETRISISTREAAYHLLREPQTLREWHCKGSYPPSIRPSVVNGRLLWPVASIRALLEKRNG